MNKLWSVLILLTAAIALCNGRAAVACTDYVHLWRPVAEERSAICGAEGIAHFLRQLVYEKIRSEKTLSTNCHIISAMCQMSGQDLSVIISSNATKLLRKT